MKRILFVLAACFAMSCLPAAHTPPDLRSIIKIERAESTKMQYKFQSAQPDADTAFICLVVDENLQEDAAEQALNNWLQRYRKEAQTNAEGHQAPVWTIGFMLKGLNNLLKSPTITMHIRGRDIERHYSVEGAFTCLLDHTLVKEKQISMSSLFSSRPDPFAGFYIAEETQIWIAVNKMLLERAFKSDKGCSIL